MTRRSTFRNPALLLPLLLLACGKVSEIGAGAGGVAGSGGSIGALGGSGGTPNGGSAVAGNAGSSGFGGDPSIGGFGGEPSTGGFGGEPSTGGFGGEPSTGGSGGGFIDEGYVVSKFFLGDTDRNGVPSSSAWQGYGVDLDGLESTQSSPNHCRLQAGANPSFKRDGPNGIDNSFGYTILPFLMGTAPDAPQELNARAASGESIVIASGGPGFSIVNPGSIGRGDTFTGMPGSEWWVFDADYPGGTPNCTLYGETINGSIIVNGFGAWELRLPVVGLDLVIPIHQTLLSGVESATGSPEDMMLSGLIRTEELVEALRQVAGAFDPSLCSGSTFDSIAQQVRSASDIRDDGTNGDSGVECNAISFGIGVNLQGALIRGFAIEPDPTPGCP